MSIHSQIWRRRDEPEATPTGRGSVISSLMEPDVWPQLYRKIVEKRADTLEACSRVSALEDLRKLQGWIECLDWLVDEATPMPPQTEDED